MGKILEILPEARTELSEYAPRITKVMINPDKIKEVIGKGGETIQRITRETGAQIDIEDSGLVMIYSDVPEAAAQAKEWIESIVAEPEVGKIYDATVIKLMDFGAFVTFLGKRDGLVHISELAPKRVQQVSDVVKEGDVVEVKDSSKQLTIVLEAMQSPERDVPDYIDMDEKAVKATFTRTPKLADVPYPVKMEPNLVVEFYSR